MSAAISAVVGGVASLAGGYFQGEATKDAAATQAGASREASAAEVALGEKSLALQKEMFDKQLALNQPWQEAGLKAMAEYASDPKFTFSYNDMTADPSYKFRVAEGVKALDMSAASRGKLLSGAQDKAVTSYGQGMASEEYANAYNRALNNYTAEQNRKLNVANIGRGAAGQTQNAMQSYTTGAANTMSGMGNALAQGALGAGTAAAQGALGAGNAWANATTGLANTANTYAANQMFYNLYNKPSLPSIGVSGNYTPIG